MVKEVLILVCFLIVLSGIGIVSAETLTGTIGSFGIQSINYSVNTAGTASPWNIDGLYFNDIQNSGGTTALIFFPYSATNENSVLTFDSGAPSGAITPIEIEYNGGIISNGTIGYARIYDTEGSELFDYLYITFDTWNISGLSGDIAVSTRYNKTALYNVRGINVGSDPPSGSIVLYYGDMYHGFSGRYYHNKNSGLLHSYSVTKPAGIGIAGLVTKTVNSVPYSSKVFITDTNRNTIQSEGDFTTENLNFSVYGDQIYISCLSPENVWFNSSLLFSSSATPTPTPTPTPTGTIGPDNPIPAGYVRSMVQAVDGQSSGAIHGSDIQIKDVEANVWANVTNRFDGSWFIDTLPNHTVDAYAQATGYTSASRLGLPASGTAMIELILWASDIPQAPAGKVILYVIVNDADSGNAVTGASVQVRDGSGVTQAQTTGTSGTRSFEVQNSSTVYVTASKYGYDTVSQAMATSVSGTDTMRIELMKSTVTTVPTATIPPGGVTTAVTVNPHDPSITGNTNASAQDMMNWLAANGMQLVQLCFLVTILGLLGVKLGK